MAAVITQPDMADIKRTDQTFEQAYTPPGWVYWDTDVYAREEQEIFGAGWLCAGHVSRLANPGDYFLVSIGTESVILSCDREGKLHAFYNVCRHRGSRLVREAMGNCKGFMCPYHAWNYASDGTLMAAPMMNETPGFKKSDYPLRPVRLEVWNGFLFINLDENAQAMPQLLDDFPDLSHLNLADMVRVGYHDYHVDANWKLISENYNECYHCSLAHPQLHRISAVQDLPQYNHTGKHYTGGPMALRDGFNTMSMKGNSARALLPGVSEQDRNMVFYFCIYPNLYLSIAPDYVLTHYLWPTGPGSVYVETEWFCAKEQVAQNGFNVDDAVEFWDTTNKQDWILCENAMRGLRSKGHRPGRYQSWESSVHDFDRWYVQTMFTSRAGDTLSDR